jgi:putative tricarboxylic transport membrane protein
MQEILEHVSLGWSAVLTLQPVVIFGAELMVPMNLVYALLGAMIGSMVGVLPGLGPVATIAMLLPATYGLPALGGLIMLAGIYYGAQYGGSTSAILVNLPGESASIVTCLDGYQMARRGRAGVALTTAALGSFFAGSVGVLVVVLFSPPLSELAFKFGPAEYFSLMTLGLVGAVALASGSPIKAIAMVCLGLLGGLVGSDVNSGLARFTFGVAELSDGLSFVAVAIGVFGLSEIVSNLALREKREVFTDKITTLYPTRRDWKRMVAPVLRGTGLGTVLGILPGGGAGLATFGAYALEKRVSKYRHELGTGAIEGVAAPEAANNAAAQTSFIPLLTLGLPSNAVMALMIGAMLLHGIQPGPQVMTSRPELFWGLIVSMWVGNVMLVILNLPLVGLWVKLLTIPYRVLYPAIMVFSCIGVYSVSSSGLDVVMAGCFGIAGYLFYKVRCEPAPLLLGFVLGPMMEENFRRSLLISEGSFAVFFTRPVSLSLLIVTALLVLSMALPAMRSKVEQATQQG